MHGEAIKLPSRGHDLTGQRRGTWTAIALDPSTKPGTLRWRVRCDCGREKVIAAYNWRLGSGTKLCACTPREPNYNQLPPGEASFNLLHQSYIRKARLRGLSFTLSRQEFHDLTSSCCGYCGKPPSQTRKTGSGTPYLYTGVDRIDSSRGYESDNVAPCCWYCNVSKHDRTLDEWKEHIQTLWERLCVP